MKKLLKPLIILSIFVGIITFIGTYYIAPKVIVMKHDITQNVNFDNYNFHSKKVNLITQDSIKLDSYLITPKTDSLKGLVIMVHGIGSCKEPFISLAENLAKQNIGTFLFDLRAHGKSGGDYCTYGYHEKKDVSIIMDYLSNTYSNIPIGIWGTSLGGAIAIQSLEHDKRINFGIIECTFTELDKIVYDYQKRICFGLGVKFITDESLAKAGKIAKFDPEKVKPINSVRNITQPMFLAHGKKDANISFEYGKELFENLNSQEKTFIALEDQGHNYFYNTAGIEYRNKVMSFINEHINK